MGNRHVIGPGPQWSPVEVFRGWCQRLRPKLRDAVMVLALSDRYSTRAPELLRCPLDDLWHLVEPGDTAFLTDGVTHHVTTVAQKDDAVIRFADAWPEEFLLLAGGNAIGAQGLIVGTEDGLGGAYQLVEVDRADFDRGVRPSASTRSASSGIRARSTRSAISR